MLVFAISEVAFPHVSPPRLADVGPKMPQNVSAGELFMSSAREPSLSRGAGMSCPPPGHPHSTGGSRLLAGGWPPLCQLLWEEVLPLSWCPQQRPWVTCGQRLSRRGWDGHSAGKGLFPLKPHVAPGSLVAAQHHCWGCCGARGGVCKGVTGCLPPKTHSGVSDCLRQLLGDS